MGSSSPSLNEIFSNIEKGLLDKFFRRHAPKFSFDWHQGYGNELAKKLFDAFDRMPNREEWSNCCTQIYDINTVCTNEKKRARNYLLNRLDRLSLKGKMISEIGKVSPSTYDIAMWICLNCGDSLWKDLVREADSKAAEKGGGVTIHYDSKRNIDYESGKRMFRTAYRTFIKKEDSHDTDIYIEMNPIGVYDRYVMHVDPFPKMVMTVSKDKPDGKADDEDRFKLDFNKNAEHFVIMDYPDDCYIRVKSGFSTRQARKIGEDFICYVLGAVPCETPKERYDLSRYVRNPPDLMVPAARIEDFIEARYAGVEMKFSYPDGNVETMRDKCTHGSIFNCSRLQGDADDHLHVDECCDREALSVEIEITVRSGYKPALQQGELWDKDNDKRLTRKYTVSISKGKKSIRSCIDEHDRKVIEKCLLAWNFVDLNSGKSPKRKPTRKTKRSGK